MDRNNSEPSTHEEVIYITAEDLPLSCPMPHQKLWDSHPRIYLPISSTGYITCPYCNIAYQLVEGSKSPSTPSSDNLTS